MIPATIFEVGRPNSDRAVHAQGKSSVILESKVSKQISKPHVTAVSTSFLHIFPSLHSRIPEQIALYPKFRYMGSKTKLLPWIHSVLATLDFDSFWDPFVGGGSSR
jgi:D12 class N6 adenine-specific DNA methyltransferase